MLTFQKIEKGSGKIVNAFVSDNGVVNFKRSDGSGWADSREGRTPEQVAALLMMRPPTHSADCSDCYRPINAAAIKATT